VAIDNAADAPSLEGRAKQDLGRVFDEMVPTTLRGGTSISGPRQKTTVSVDAIVKKVMYGGRSLGGLDTSGLNWLTTNSDTYAGSLVGSLMAVVTREVGAAASNTPAHDVAVGAIDQDNMRLYVLAGIQEAARKISQVHRQALTKYYNAVKRQAGKVSDEIDVNFLELRALGIGLWIDGTAMARIEAAVTERARELFGKKKAKASGSARYTMSPDEIDVSWERGKD
jgi:hypothetical protein